MGPFSDGWTRSDVEAVLAQDNPDDVLYIPIVIGMNAPNCGGEWAEVLCLQLAKHSHWNVRSNALLGLEHIARTCGHLNLDLALPVLQCGLNDPSPEVRGHAVEVIQGLKVFLRSEINKHPLLPELERQSRPAQGAGGDALYLPEDHKRE